MVLCALLAIGTAISWIMTVGLLLVLIAFFARPEVTKIVLTVLFNSISDRVLRTLLEVARVLAGFPADGQLPDADDSDDGEEGDEDGDSDGGSDGGLSCDTMDFFHIDDDDDDDGMGGGGGGTGCLACSLFRQPPGRQQLALADCEHSFTTRGSNGSTRRRRCTFCGYVTTQRFR